ncbi:hypothetical protein JCM10207_008854 [Rhodosporidiobolus poonsookiae]
MALAFDGFPRPRTISAQLRDFDAQAGSAWNEWSTTGYSPDRPAPGTHHAYPDPLVDLEASFGDFAAHHPSPAPPYPHGLGFEVQMHMAGIQEEPLAHGGDGHELLDGRGLDSAAASNALAPATAQPYPASSCSSPARSRASSLRSIAPPDLQMSALTSPASPFFPGGLPSPFHDQAPSFHGTINPAQSVRSSSPSDTSSVFNLNTSRIESSSTASSVYGGDAASTAPSTPHRSNSISSRGTGSERASHHKHLRRRSSPMKGARHSRKLSNADRKAICQFHLQHPTLKQDDIGAHFGYERSTISKTLKFKDKYLAMASDDETSATAVIRSAQEEVKQSFGSHGPSPDGVNEFGVVQNGLAASSSVSSLRSLDSHASADFNPSASTSHGAVNIVGGRFPQIDNALAAWARQQAALGQVLSDAAMQRQARTIARTLGSDNFKASQTWLDGFKHRAGISGGTFLDMLPPNSPPAPAPTPTPTSQRWLPPPKEEEDEEDDIVDEHLHEDDDDYDLPANTRRSKRRTATKSVRRLTAAKTHLGSFAESSPARSMTPQRVMDVDGGMHGGSFGDLSMDADATPTHTTVHSRASTAATERPNGLAQPFSYSPTGLSETGSIVTSTPSRMAGGSDYSPPDHYTHGGAFGYPGGLATSYSSHDLGGSVLSTSSSHSSLANFNGGLSGASTACRDPNASPAPGGNGAMRHGRSGSTASTNSVYSGLTAFSTNSQGLGTPLTGSLYGSFRDSQANLCSVPGTPAHGVAGGAASTGYFTGDPLTTSTTSSQYSQPLALSSSSSSQHQHSSHQRYPQASLAYPPHTPSRPHDPHSLPSQHSQSLSQSAGGSAGRRATISGGAPFNATAAALRSSGSAAMAPSLSSGGSLSRPPSTAPTAAPVTFEQALSSVEVALEFLSTRAGQDLVSPKDLIVLSDLKGKMERSRRAHLAPLSISQASQGVHTASAPPTPSGLGPGSAAFLPSAAFGSPFGASAGQAQAQPSAPVSATHKQRQRTGLARTQSTSSVPGFGAMGAGAGALDRGMMTRRSGSALSLFEVDGH